MSVVRMTCFEKTRMAAFPAPTIAALRTCLLDLSQPIAKRTQAAFYLRTDGSDAAVDVVLEAILQKEDTALMRHELGYILGQFQNTKACATLSQILDDESDDVLVRHESAEALGAIGSPSSLEILCRYSTHASPEIAETCQIAIDLINWKIQESSVTSAAGAAGGGGLCSLLERGPRPPPCC